MNLEKALRLKYRFPSPVGQLTLEQLWDLPLESSKAGKVANLNDTAKEINRELRAQLEDNFVSTTPSKVKTELEEKLAIVVHVIEVRMAENKEAALAAEKRAKKAQLLEILHDRNTEELRKKSPAEIEAMINAL